MIAPMVGVALAADADAVAIVILLGLGCALGAGAFALAREPLPLGLAGALVAGGLGALLGASAESLLEGSRRFELDPASAAGAACGALMLVAMVARAGGTSLQRSRDV